MTVVITTNDAGQGVLFLNEYPAKNSCQKWSTHEDECCVWACDTAGFHIIYLYFERKTSPLHPCYVRRKSPGVLRGKGV